MNQFYDVAIDALLRGDLDMLDDPLVLTPYDGAGFDPAATTITYATPIATAVALANRSVDARTLYADNVLYPVIAANRTLQQLVITRSSDALLVAYIDTRPDRMPLYVAGNGGAIEIVWNQRAVMTL